MALEAWFLRPTGLWALITLIPLLILYLIRPHPQTQTIPSLMFLFKDKGKRVHSSFLYWLLRDLVFLIQLLTILFLAMLLAQPYLEAPASSFVTSTVIVLDDSASMHSTDTGKHRYEEARDIAMANLGKTNTIILAGTLPEAVLVEADESEAQLYLESWEASHQPTKLAPAITATQDYLGADSRLVIISDFSDQSDADFRDSIKIIEAKGYTVDTYQVGVPGPVENIGIVSADVTESRTTLQIKNFYDQGKTVMICAQQTCEDLALPAGGLEAWSFQTPPGLTKVTIDTGDKLAVDDQVYVSSPVLNSLNVLVVTNGDFENSFISHALRSISDTTPLQIRVELGVPPRPPDVDHDVVIFTDVDPALPFAKTIRQTIDSVSAGGAAIIVKQDKLFQLGFKELLPFDYQGEGTATYVENDVSNAQFIDIDFGTVNDYSRVKPQKKMDVVARAPDGSLLIAFYTLGAGRVLYYGLGEDASFSADSLYPVFWKRALDLISGRPPLDSLNRQTGELMINQEQVMTPEGDVVQGTIILKTEGAYEGEYVVAANLLNQEESNIEVQEFEEGRVRNFIEGEDLRPRTYDGLFLSLVLLLVFLELTYMKWRGDL